MTRREQWRELVRSRPVRTALFMSGLLIILLSPVVGALPGPGGIFVFAAGLTLTLRNSDWAKRQYVRFKRWQPKAGSWADWGLRRPSARRREALRKQRVQQEKLAPPADLVTEAPIDATKSDPPVDPAEKWSDGKGRTN